MKPRFANSFRRIYLIRHAEPVFPGIRQGKQYIGQMDLEMGPAGLAQAEKLARGLKWVNFEAVYSSDLIRAKTTADIVAQPHRLTPVTDAALREISLGQWEGRYFSELQKTCPDDFKKRGEDFAHFTPQGGENFLMLTQRVLPAFFKILDSHQGDIAIVSHSGVIRAVLCQILDMPIESQFNLKLDYCSVNILRQYDDKLTLELLNYTFDHNMF